MENVKDNGRVVYVGVNDRAVDLFEGMYVVPNGVSYNSYIILGKKTVVMDTVDHRFAAEWLGNIKRALFAADVRPDYLVVSHMEPDHSGSIAEFMRIFPDVKIVGNSKTFVMLAEYFPELDAEKKPERFVAVKDGDTLDLGDGELKFIFAPMVHWPEVMVAFDTADGTLYSADGFGKFGALDCDEPWDDEARRYYIGIVGKYGAQVQALFKKLDGLAIKTIRPLHGPVLSDDLGHYLGLYDKWSSYVPESDGVMIAYTSVYGHTKKAAVALKRKLDADGTECEIFDLARADRAECVAKAFKYGKLVLATTTYNGEVFPAMREFIYWLAERNYQNRRVALIENGTWAPVAAKAMQTMLEKCKGIEYVCEPIKIRAAANAETDAALDTLASALAK